MIVWSCAGGKKVRISRFDYELGEHAKITVNSLKRFDQQLELEVLGISLQGEKIAIKHDEIECGVGNDKYSRVSVVNGKDDLIIFNRSTFHEFTIVCLNETDLKIEKDPYLVFKNIYDFTGDKLGKVLSTNIKIKLK